MPGSNYLVARSLDRATDESSSARRVSSNGSEAACLTTHPTDDPLLVARLTLPMSLSPASLLSRRPLFARDTLTRPFKSWRTFDNFWQLIVRDSTAWHLRAPAVHQFLTRQNEQWAPSPPLRPCHTPETVKICQYRARGDSNQIISHQHSNPAPQELAPTNCPSSSHRAHHTAPRSPHPRHTVKPERSSTSSTSSSGTHKVTLTHPLSRHLHL